MFAQNFRNCLRLVRVGANYNQSKLLNRLSSTGLVEKETPDSQAEKPFKDSDVFGQLGGRKYELYEADPIELAAEEEEKYYPAIPRKMKFSPGQYALMIKNYVAIGDLQKAKDVLLLIKKNGDQSNAYIYNLLINGYANHGEVGACFDLFRAMKAKKLAIKPNTITSLFNAIACHPQKDKAEFYFKKLNDYIQKENYPLSQVHYNVMIKAYGRHHMIEEAYKAADKMLDNKMVIGISTINSLMYAAITDKESGLKLVIRTWQLMKKYSLIPNLLTFNLVLRAIRETKFGKCKLNDILIDDSDIGEQGVAKRAFVVDENRPDLLCRPPVLSYLPIKSCKNQVLLASGEKDTNKTFKKPTSEIVQFNPEHLDLDAILRENKLILFGGFNGFMKKMEEVKSRPDIKTMTYMIELVPDSTAAENLVVQYAEQHKIEFDIDFFNMLIKKRSSRGDKEAAKAVIDNIHTACLKPNIMTYGVLALTCNTTTEGRELLETLKFTGLSVNKYIIDTLITAAMRRFNFAYMLELMEIAYSDRIRLDEETFKKLDHFQNRMTRLIKEKYYLTKQEPFKLGFRKFNLRYKTWQEQMGRESAEKMKLKT